MYIFKYFIPVLLGLSLFQSCSNFIEEPDVEKPPVEEATEIEIQETPSAESEEEGNLKSVTLPGGTEIKYAPESMEEQIVNFMNSDEPDMKQGFSFSDVPGQISNIAALLDAFSTSTIKLEGKDAESIKSALVSKGVADERIEAKTGTNDGCKLFFKALY